jgi:hypothetical protein
VPKEQLYIYAGEQVAVGDIKIHNRLIMITNEQEILNGNTAYIGYFGSAMKKTPDGTLLELPNKVLVRQVGGSPNYELYMGKTVASEYFVESKLVQKVIDTPKRFNPNAQVQQTSQPSPSAQAKPKIEVKKAGL